jgi:hypothetical protein
MEVVRFTGLVLPSATPLTVSPQERHWNLEDYGIPATLIFKFSISSSVIEAECTNPSDHPCSLTIYAARVHDLLFATTAIITFGSGQYFYPYLDKVHYQDGTSLSLTNSSEEFASLSTSVTPRTPGAGIIADIVYSDLSLMVAMRDLADTFLNAHRIPAAGYRAVSGKSLGS